MTALPREQFPVTERWRYFDHAGVSPLPQCAYDAIHEWAERWMRQGKVDYGEIEEAVEGVRASAARLMGVLADDVAFIKNTTEGLGFVANGLDLQPGARVLVPDHEFPSTLYAWLALRERGVVVDIIETEGDGWALPVEAFERAIDRGPAPQVIALSWVSFGRGWRNDVGAITKLAHDAGALVCADIIQGLGVIPVDLTEWDVDFAVTAGHKWLLGPEGQGLMYVAPAVRNTLRPLEPGWQSVAHRSNYDNLTLVWHDNARRFEGGTFNTAGILALGASIDMLLDAGVEQVWTWADRLCDRLCAATETVAGLTVLSDRSAHGRSAVVNVAVDGLDPTNLTDALRHDGFVCSPRGGGIRIAPHGYNTEAETDALVSALAQLSAGASRR